MDGRPEAPPGALTPEAAPRPWRTEAPPGAPAGGGPHLVGLRDPRCHDGARATLGRVRTEHDLEGRGGAACRSGRPRGLSTPARRPKPVSPSGVTKPGLTLYQRGACGRGKHTRPPPSPAPPSGQRPRSRLTPRGAAGGSRSRPAPSPSGELAVAPVPAAGPVSLACSSPAPRAARPPPALTAAHLGCVRPVHVAQGHRVLPGARRACGRAPHSARARQHPTGAGSAGQQVSHRPRGPPSLPAVPLGAGLVQPAAGSVLDALSGTNHGGVKRCVPLTCPQAASVASPLPRRGPRHVP